MEAAGITLFWLGVAVILCGAISWAVAHNRSRNAELEAMSPDQKAWYESELARRGAIKAAEKGHKVVAGAEARSLRDAQQALATAQAVGTRPLGAVGVVRLAEDRADVGGVTFAFSQGPVSTRVDVVLPSKAGSQQDPGSATLWVSGSQGSASARLPYAQLKSLQALADKIEVASHDWPSLSQRAASGVAEASAALAAAKQHQQAVLERSAADVETVKSDRADVDEARSRVQTAFCPRCGRNVAVTEDTCPEGHGALLDYRPDHPKQVRAAKRPRRGVRIAQAVLASGVGLLAMGLALVPAPPAPAVAERPDRSDTATAPIKAASVDTSASETDVEPGPSQSAETAQPDRAADAADEEREQETFLAFEREVYAAEKPATNAIKTFQATTKEFDKGDATLYELYEDVMDAKRACSSVQASYWELEPPSDLPSDVRDLLGEALQSLSTSYMVQAEAFEAMGKYLDDQKMSEAEKSKEKMSLAQSFNLDAVGKMLEAREKLGIPLDAE